MRYFGENSSIRRRLTVIIFLVTFLTGLLGYAAFLTWTLTHQQEKALDDANTLGQVLNQDFARLVLMNEVAVAADIHSKLNSFDLLESLILYSQQGTAIFQYQTATSTKVSPHPLPPLSQQEMEVHQGLLSFYLPLTYENLSLGTAYFQFHIDTLIQRLQRDAPAILGIGFAMFALSSLLAALVALRFTEPILRLVRFFELTKAPLESSERPNWPEKNEFGRLYQEVNTMLDRLQLANTAQRLAAVAFETPTGMVITDANNVILRVNQAFTDITGYSAKEVMGRSPVILRSGRHPPIFYEHMWLKLKEKQRWEGEIWNRHKNGTVYPERLTIQAVPDEQGKPAFYVGAFIDLSELRAAKAEAEYLGLFDPLTGLANRMHLEQRLDTSLKNCYEKASKGILFCFDFDNFKIINDSYGHDIGDQLLVKLAQNLRLHFNDKVFLARISADEFAAIVENNQQQSLEEATYAAEETARALLQLMQQTIKIQGMPVKCNASIGITLYPCVDRITAKQLIQQAELALHQAKQLDSAEKIGFFDPEAQRLTREHLELSLALEQAIARDEFELYYQAQFNQYRQVVGAEALIRWQHPDKGWMLPGQFIPIAERSTLILALGQWVLSKACQQLANWQQQPIKRDWILAVNVSSQQFQQTDFITQIQGYLDTYQINPKKLKLELTEAVLLVKQQDVIEKMHHLIDLGLQIAMDDFGTGYSSLSYLQHLPLNQIKIDRSFVQDLQDEPRAAAIIKSVVSIGQAFGLEVIAEGIETQEQFDLLRSMGCYLYQGFYFARPQPLATFEQNSC